MFPSTATRAAALAAVNVRLPSDEKLESDRPDIADEDVLKKFVANRLVLNKKRLAKLAPACELFAGTVGMKVGDAVALTEAKTETLSEP